MAKLEEVANSATCVADTSQTSNSFLIKETASFEPLLNISADEEVPESTETFLEPAPRPNPWRAREKKKKTLRRPQIAFTSADSEIEAISDACGPPSGAQAKSQEASNPVCTLIVESLWSMAFHLRTTLPPQVSRLSLTHAAHHLEHRPNIRRRQILWWTLIAESLWSMAFHFRTIVFQQNFG